MMDVQERRALRLARLKELLRSAEQDREGYAIQLEYKDRQIEYLVKEITRLEGEHDGSSDGRAEAGASISAGD